MEDHNGLLLFSVPRQGTDWFMDCVTHSHPNLIYFREYFNPTCNSDHADTLLKHFGSELRPKNLWVPTTGNAANTVDTLWRATNLKITKEVYSFEKLSAFASFRRFGLYRSRRYTFPTSQPSWFEVIYERFLARGPSTGGLGHLKFHFRRCKLPSEGRQVVGYIAAWCSHLEYANLNELPVLRYRDLMLLNEQSLYAHLAVRVPDRLDSRRLAHSIVHRRNNPEWLEGRKSSYESSQFEEYAEEALYILNLYTDTSYAASWLRDAEE